MANNEQVRKLIQQIVREELNRTLPTLIKEAFANMLTESLQSVKSRPQTGLTKRQIQESVEEGYEEYPTLGNKTFDRSRMAELMGYGNTAPARPNNLILVDSMNSEHEAGPPRPIDPNSIPDHLIQAFNKDYRGLMKTLEEKKRNG